MMEKQKTRKRIPKADLINLLIEFVNIYGREPKHQEQYKNVNIGTFLMNIRQGNTTLSSEDKELLISAGIRITSNKKLYTIHENVLLLVEFYNLYHRTPKQNEIYKNINLYNFLIRIRSGVTTLSSEDEELLINTGIRITSNRSLYTMHEKVLLLVEFYNLYNRTPTQREKYKGFNIGAFIVNIRQGNTTLSSEDKELLIDSGIRITSNKRLYTIHEKVLLLIEFYNLYHRHPKEREIYKNIKLGQFLDSIRQNKTVLLPEDVELLTNTGIKITPNIKQTIIHEKVLLLVEFYDLYHRTPTQNEVYKNTKLGKFLHNIRYGNTNLPFEDKQLLINTGIRITSNKRQDTIHQKVLFLVEFYNLYHRHPKRNETYKNINLYNFLIDVKRGATTLSSKDKELLINTGITITSNKRLYTIHEKVLLLVEFYNLYNRTPKQNEIYKDIKLGTFLNSIRQNKTALSPEDKELLITNGIRITRNKKKNFQKN